jgi:4-aminobutyrate aminotransferase / (S)-3-amino-2-methylpropionate transaminase / 5-aminovalerate transaminase
MFVQGVKKVCEKYGILFISDEIQTGFGRTGKMFAIEHVDVVPDMITMSKSIAAGLPISTVTGRAEIINSAELGKIGETYGGNSLGCVAALKIIEMMEEEGLVEKANFISQTFVSRFERMKEKFPVDGEVGALASERSGNKETE